MTFVAAYYKKCRIDWRMLLLYVSFLAMIGPVGEVFVGTLYQAVAGVPLWHYQFAPIHHGYTSLFAPVIWGLSGVLLYASQELLRLGKGRTQLVHGAIVMVETIAFEAILNLGFLLASGALLFYYTPGDLWHVTSLQTLPFYFLFGIVTTKAIKRFRTDWRFFSAMCLLLTVVFVYFAR